MDDHLGKSILLIVEGAKREPQLMKQLFRSFALSDKYQIVSATVNIHDFLSKLYIDYGSDFEGVDLVDLIVDLNPDGCDADQLLAAKFTDILLIFDLDPQDDRRDFERLQAMQKYYCDSTDMGQLFLNYPSVEAYRDFNPERFDSLLDATVPSNVIYQDPSYKHWVTRRGDRLADIGRIDSYTFASIIAVHGIRALMITEGDKPLNDLRALNDLSLMLDGVDLALLLRREIEFLEKGTLYACCTCLFFLANWPKRLNDVWNKARMRGLGIPLSLS